MAKVTIDSKEYAVAYEYSDVLDLDSKRNVASQVAGSDYVLIRKGTGTGSPPW